MLRVSESPNSNFDLSTCFGVTTLALEPTDFVNVGGSGVPGVPAEPRKLETPSITHLGEGRACDGGFSEGDASRNRDLMRS